MKNIQIISGLILAIVFSGSSGNCQVTDMGGPFGWKGVVSYSKNAARYEAPGFDLAAILAEDLINDAAKDAPWRFGYKYDTHLTLNDGNWIPLENGDRLWRLEIACPNALSINLILEDYTLPEGAALYLYDRKETNRVGAYTSRNNRDDGTLGTELVLGDHIVVEYYEPHSVQGEGNFTIKNVVHGYRSLDIIQEQLEKNLNDSGDCNYDVECMLGNGWEDQIRSVAMIVVGGNAICSGALINNTCEDGRPLILSANHCLGTSTSNWAFRFNWKTAPGSEACGTTGTSIDPGPPYDETANGATVLASGTEADHLLLEVDNMMLADAINWNLYYSGWNHDDNATIANATCIHHPSGDVMKITKELDSPYHSSAGQAAVWWIDNYEFGTTEGGSSGSPLYDNNQRIIGQLFGGTAACSGTNPNGSFDYFGRLGIAWDYGLAEHLAPIACGDALVLDGWDPLATSELDDASIQSVNEPLGDVCGNSFEASVELRNAGDNYLTSCDIIYRVDGGTNATYNWTGNLAPNSTTTIILNTLSPSGGAHTFTAYTSNPNGVADTDNTNDTVTVNFDMNLNTINTFININTDCYGYETAWEIYDAGNSLITSGGNALVPPGGNQTASSSDPNSYGNETTITEKRCLAVGCYDFIIYDDWGDGLEGSSQFGCDVDGNYSITNSSGTVLGSMQNVAFGISETTNFCVVNDAGLEPINNTYFDLYPNPASTILHIVYHGNETIETITINDISGKLIKSMDQPTETTLDVSSLAAGSYLIQIEAGSIISVQRFTVH